VDYEISLAQVLVEIDAIENLLNDLSRWRDDATHFERQLTPESAGQKLVLSVCHDPGLIYSVDKPAFKICYSNGASMSAKWMFVVDQSCIWLAMESIKGALEVLSETWEVSEFQSWRLRGLDAVSTNEMYLRPIASSVGEQNRASVAWPRQLMGEEPKKAPGKPRPALCRRGGAYERATDKSPLSGDEA
jgi:hypothetical protein